MRPLLHRFIGDKTGVTAIEYGLIASLIAVATIAAVSTLGTNLQTVFGQVAGSLT
ncbi:MAG: Flp family type IVb pilin [Methylocella sp.]